MTTNGRPHCSVRQILWATFCLALLSFFLPPIAAAAETADSPMVNVVKVSPTKLADNITYPAQTVSSAEAKVTANLDGVVNDLSATLGERVHRGQRLLSLKNNDPGYSYVAVNVSAPISGLVSSIKITAGEAVHKGDVLATVVDPKDVKMLVELIATDLPRVKPGIEGRFTTEGPSPLDIPVVVRGVSPLVDAATGTATAELVPKGYTKPLPIGLVGQLTFSLRKRTALTVPEDALTYRGEKTFVRVVENGHAHFREVTPLETNAGQVEIGAGLKSGDLVVIHSSAYVADGAKVTVQGSVARK